MSARQPIAAVMKIVELGRMPTAREPRDPVAATELRRLLSRPLAPLSELDRRERRKITDARLAGLAAAFAEVRPVWIGDYAASAAVALPLRERRLREFMLHELFRSLADPALALAALGKPIRKLPVGRRMSVLVALLGGIAKLANTLKPAAFEDIERSLKALVEALPAPGSPKSFMPLAVSVADAAAKLSQGAARTGTQGAASSPAGAVMAPLDDAHRGFLLRTRWGALAPEIGAVLWDQLWQGWRPVAAPAKAPVVLRPAEPPQPTQQVLLKEAAWSEADQAIARALQDAGRLSRSLDRLDAVATGDAAARAASTRGASDLMLQWVRQAARLRGLECLESFGTLLDFDPVLHESGEALPGERVRVVKPTVVRSNGAEQAVVLRGEVEPE